jgi:hypothetical protein
MKTGSCLCGGVAFEVERFTRDVLACHCTQCRKQTGHFAAFTKARDQDITFIRSEPLKWYKASDFASRGFCSACGSVMFWREDQADSTSIAAGCLDGATEMKIEGHIYCANAGDYYEITGGDYQKP